MTRTRTLAITLAAVIAAGMVWFGLGATLRASSATDTPFVDITSAGPLTDVVIGNDLGCQIAHTGDTAFELYPPSTKPGDCGTFLFAGGTVYGPDFDNHGGGSTATNGAADFTPFTPVSQSGVTGSGTAGDPYRVVTTVDAGATGIRLVETDTYVVGAENYRTDVQLVNTGGTAQTVRMYRAGDCYLGSSDSGYGMVMPASKTVACTKTANNTPADRIEQWSPITPADHYYEARYSTVWSSIAAAATADLPDTCDCTISEDNGAALSWNVSLAPQASTVISQVTTFSPLGAQPLAITKTASSPSVAAGAGDSYTITITNPNAAPATVGAVVDTLPAGFNYVPASSTGVTTTDPGIVGQVLTWTGPFNVATSITLTFGVTVSSTPGTYYNSVSTTGGTDSVPTGDTAPITVTEATPTPTPVVTNTPTNTPTATDTAIATETATPQATATTPATATLTPTASATGVAGATTTAVPTRTAVSTRTVVTTRTAVSTTTVVSTRTAVSTTTVISTPTASVTATVQATQTPATSTATRTPTAVNTSTSTATRVASTSTRVASTSTSTASARTSTSTATPVSGVLGINRGPAGGGAAGASTLPSTGSAGSAGRPWSATLLASIIAIALFAGGAMIASRSRRM